MTRAVPNQTLPLNVESLADVLDKVGDMSCVASSLAQWVSA